VNLGLFGGTFDPPHVGHLIVAQDAADALGLDRVAFIPAAQPPHKRGRPITPAPVRARMVELAIDGDPRFYLEPLELERTGPSYTADTLRALRARMPEAALTLLLGRDQYEELDSWHEADTVRRLARLGVMTRGAEPPFAGALVPYPSPEVVVVDVTRIDVSSTAIRARAAAGLSVRHLVPPAVAQFIFDNRLYSRNGIPVKG